ncbi:unnamed protein product [Thlaspi arvense]|uniref:TF-B3 domain-containing protein n=1 Tax=Thlaspi arvense TaxID=13288 RepID=A0AAU9SCL8_THLAR|nr:unnamed protein product [Thlaspi arvense]
MMRDDDGGDDDQRREGSPGEKRSFDLMARLFVDFVDEETKARRGNEEEEERNSVGTKSFFGKRKTDAVDDSQQNPNRHDASSSSMSDDEPIRETKPNSVRGKSVKGLTKRGKVLRGSGSSQGYENENMEVVPYAESFLGKRKIDEFESQQQNPNRHDASSSSMSCVASKRRLLVPDGEPIRAEPIREIKPPVRSRIKPAIREPVRRERAVMPEWVVDRMREENATDAKLITEKGIKASDLSTQLARLLIPFNQMEEMDFLNEAEQIIIEEHRSKISKKGVPVNLVSDSGRDRDRNRKQWKLNLKRWDMKTSCNYVLNSGWNDVSGHHRLRVDQIIRLWSFHSQRGKRELFFALELVPPPPAPAMALAPALAQAQDPVPAAASSSTPVPVATRDSEELHIARELVPPPPAPAMAPEPALAPAQAPAPLPAAASSSTPAPVATRDSEELSIGEASRLEAQEETNTRTSPPLSPRGLRAAEILVLLSRRGSGQNS